VDPSRRAALLAAARRLFLDRGYDAVTMGEIARQARVAKATLYANFPERSALLEAVIRAESRRILGDEYLARRRGLAFEATLRRVGVRVLSFLTDPQRIRLERLIAGAAEQYPELATRFFEAGPGRGRAILTQLIAAGAHEGAIEVEDPGAAAGDLLGLWQGYLRIETVLRYRRIGPAEVRARAARGVRLFLRLYGPSTVAPAARRRASGPAGSSSS
jgi:TetR/AcrR family transcriptional repressor of mexJK operon